MVRPRRKSSGLSANEPRVIREALRSDLTLRTDMPPGVFDKIYALFLEHAQSRGFQPRPYGSLLAAWEWFQ